MQSSSPILPSSPDGDETITTTVADANAEPGEDIRNVVDLPNVNYEFRFPGDSWRYSFNLPLSQPASPPSVRLEGWIKFTPTTDTTTALTSRKERPNIVCLRIIANRRQYIESFLEPSRPEDILAGLKWKIQVAIKPRDSRNAKSIVIVQWRRYGHQRSPYLLTTAGIDRFAVNIVAVSTPASRKTFTPQLERREYSYELKIPQESAPPPPPLSSCEDCAGSPAPSPAVHIQCETDHLSPLRDSGNDEDVFSSSLISDGNIILICSLDFLSFSDVKALYGSCQRVREALNDAKTWSLGRPLSSIVQAAQTKAELPEWMKFWTARNLLRSDGEPFQSTSSSTDLLEPTRLPPDWSASPSPEVDDPEAFDFELLELELPDDLAPAVVPLFPPHTLKFRKRNRIFRRRDRLNEIPVELRRWLQAEISVKKEMADHSMEEGSQNGSENGGEGAETIVELWGDGRYFANSMRGVTLVPISRLILPDRGGPYSRTLYLGEELSHLAYIPRGNQRIVISGIAWVAQ